MRGVDRSRWSRFHKAISECGREGTAGLFAGPAGRGFLGGQKEAKPSCFHGNTPRYGSAKGNKKAGEYSEEDTHRPAHHYREVVARRTVGQVTGQSAIVTLEKETL